MNNDQKRFKEYKNYSFEIKNKVITYIDAKKPTKELKGKQKNMFVVRPQENLELIVDLSVNGGKTKMLLLILY